ncbi:Kinesin-like protein KIF15 [Diplonema papillatum]|nr:Kinesin-like protein KIF15 [Diplonema papillatum]
MSHPSPPFTREAQPGEKERVKVCLRVRPVNALERSNGFGEALSAVSPTTVQTFHTAQGGRKVEKQTHTYDCVYPPDATQAAVFAGAQIGELCQIAMSGYPATVFAYGQTGSGKTHTMLGPPGSLDGVIPMAARWIFANKLPTVTVRVSFLEIYNEQVYDLLSPSSGVLPVRWSATTNCFYVESALVVACDDVDDLMAVIEEGASNRSSSSHLLNADSSRSHSIMSLYFEDLAAPAGSSAGKLNLVDLAGSERVKDTLSTGGAMVESCHINKSLLVLGQVITSLYDASLGATRDYIPYRDSKLTKLLMDSLGGVARTTMIACITPAAVCIDETLNTLKYASRSRCIANTTPIVRQDRGVAAHQQAAAHELAELKLRVHALSQENSQLRKGMPTSNHGGVSSSAPAGPHPPADRAGGGSPSSRGGSPGYPPNGSGELLGADCQRYRDTIAMLQFENEQLRVDNVSLRKQLYQQQQQAGPAPTDSSVATAPPGTLVLKRPKRLLFSPQTATASAALGDTGAPSFVPHPLSTTSRTSSQTSDSYSAAVAPGPFPTSPSAGFPSPDVADTIGSQTSKDAVIRHLKSLLVRLVVDARTGDTEADKERSISDVANENLQLVQVLNEYDILRHAMPSRPKRSSDSVLGSVGSDAQARTKSEVAELKAQVAELQHELDYVTTASEPDLAQHLAERRELRLQKETNSLLRRQIKQLRRQSTLFSQPTAACSADAQTRPS